MKHKEIIMIDKALALISPYKIGIYIGVFFLALAVFAGMKFQINKLEKERDQAKQINAYYELQFKSLADSYKSSIKQFEDKKEVVHTIYRDRIKTAVKIVPSKECDYIKTRIKDYVKDNNNSK